MSIVGVENFKCFLPQLFFGTSNNNLVPTWTQYILYDGGLANDSARQCTSITAVKISINIMNAFIEMRKYLVNSQLMIEKINNIELNQLEYKIVTNERLAQQDKEN